MKKTMCELFAGVGGFRCGLNRIHELDDMKKPEDWDTVWFNQWEPGEKKTQYAHDCYVYHFGTRTDLLGNDTTNSNIEEVKKEDIPDFNLLVGGFPCQDYSVASTLVNSKGLEGKKGILWWSIRDILEAKKPPFVLLENVDRLLKSPAKQRGRDFGIILSCFRDQGYIVEWRVINAADYGFQQRRRRTFIFAYRDDVDYARGMKKFEEAIEGADEATCLTSFNQFFADVISSVGFFSDQFPVEKVAPDRIRAVHLPEKIGDVSDSFSFAFANAGVMCDGYVYTTETKPVYDGNYLTLGDMMEGEDVDVDEKCFISEEELYWTDPDVTASDEMKEPLTTKQRHTWQYIKGSKKLPRKSPDGHVYAYTEGAMSMLDSEDKPARTMLTSEGGFGRSTHIVKDRKTGRIRCLTPAETERIQGFPTDHTKFCKVGDRIVEMPANKRRFMMGNALVVNLVEKMGITLDRIFSEEN